MSDEDQALQQIVELLEKGAQFRSVHMSREIKCYLISEAELDQLANSDRPAVIGDVSTVLIGAAASAAVSFAIAGSWRAFGASLILGVFAGWVSWDSRPPRDQHDEMIDQIKDESYEPLAESE